MHHSHTSRQYPLRWDTNIMLKYILFGAVAALIIGFVIYTVIRNSKIRKNGVEADAVVSRIDEEQTVSSEGDYYENAGYSEKERSELYL